MDSFLHTHDSQALAPLCCFHIKPCTRITYLEFNLALAAEQVHCELPSSAVLQCVVQRFLRHAEEAQRNFGRDLRRHVLVSEFNIYGLLFRELLAEGPQPSNNAKVLQLGGVKLMGQGLDVECDLAVSLRDY